MPTWGQLLQELNQLQAQIATMPQPQGTPNAWDVLRRKYMAALASHTNRAVIVYATAWLEPRFMDAQTLTIQLGDMQGFMEAVSNVQERKLDLFLHSPGGSAEAAESIVEYLRPRFDHIRVIVPIAAMSAATMMALAADEIMMGAHSQLGPIDPQLSISTPEGLRSAPAQAILDQFELAKTECRNPNNLAAWLPILRSYLPGLIAQCHSQRKLAEEYAKKWLKAVMFKNDSPDEQEAKAEATAKWFSDFKEFSSHGRRVSREAARVQGLNVTNLEADHDLQDAILSVHHAVALTLSQTAAVKIIENHHGRAWLQMLSVQTVGMPVAPQQPAAPTQPSQPARQLGPNRQQRRHPKR